MKESTKKNQNNQVHLYGFINGVRMNEFGDEGKKKTAINLDVCTLEQYRDKDGEAQTKRTYHDVAIFSDDAKLIEQFKGISADCEKNVANRNVEGFNPTTHTISMDGILVNKSESRDLQIIASPDAIDLDTKQDKEEVRNSSKLTGNVANIALHEEQKFAVVTLIHHYRPEGSEKEFETVVDVRISGDRKFSKGAYDAIVKGELGKGDFVRMGGQLHNNRFETDKGTKYGVNLDLTSFDVIKKAAAKKEDVKAAPAKKADAKKGEKETKVAKKATSRKKGTVLKA
jgi:hypothetical protein